jgi:hypothetical protein
MPQWMRALAGEANLGTSHGSSFDMSDPDHHVDSFSEPESWDEGLESNEAGAGEGSGGSRKQSTGDDLMSFENDIEMDGIEDEKDTSSISPSSEREKLPTPSRPSISVLTGDDFATPVASQQTLQSKHLPEDQPFPSNRDSWVDTEEDRGSVPSTARPTRIGFLHSDAGSRPNSDYQSLIRDDDESSHSVLMIGKEDIPPETRESSGWEKVSTGMFDAGEEADEERIEDEEGLAAEIVRARRSSKRKRGALEEERRRKLSANAEERFRSLMSGESDAEDDLIDLGQLGSSTSSISRSPPSPNSSRPRVPSRPKSPLSSSFTGPIPRPRSPKSSNTGSIPRPKSPSPRVSQTLVSASPQRQRTESSRSSRRVQAPISGGMRIMGNEELLAGSFENLERETIMGIPMVNQVSSGSGTSRDWSVTAVRKGSKLDHRKSTDKDGEDSKEELK